ncbi:4-coumarate--CoA ligase-like 7 [Aristolochia californica]|uniref:4-coumarate--CoA ligase-like 7 n=1 Tax=Aristolochia californica TaxID=171875 RepID=UPI0035E02ADF
MASQDVWNPEEESSQRQRSDPRSGYCHRSGVYRSLLHLAPHHRHPNDLHLHTTNFVLSHFPHPDHAHSKLALVDSAVGRRLTYADLRRSVLSLAAALHHGLGLRKGDVVLLLAANSYLYPPTCLAVLSVGAVLTTANPLYTSAEIAKQVRDSAAKLIVCSPDLHDKLLSIDVPVVLTHRHPHDDDKRWISIEEMIEGGEPLDAPVPKIRQSDPAAVLYSSGTTGVNKGCVLTHGNLIAIVNLLRWTAETETLVAPGDVFLAFLPMFHIYGLAFFALGLFTTGATVVTMQRFDFDAMLEAVQKYGVTNLPSVPPVILALVKKDTAQYNLSSLRRVGSGAAPLGKEVADGFRAKFPWIQLRQGYGLTETSGAATFFVSAKDSRARPSSVGVLFPGFEAKVVEEDSGVAMPPGRKGELWLRSGTVMKCYHGNEEATAGAIDSEGWLRTGDLGYFDEHGFLYIVDRIKELIKHNGYQVAPAELEALLVTHPHILDAAVVPEEAEDVGQIPVAFVVRAADSQLTEKQVIQFVANQVAPFKKVKKVSFINVIPRSAAGKIMRRQLMTQIKHSASKL